MQGVNAQVVAAVNRWLAHGEAVWLATITKTWGASPRPAGSLFAYCAGRDEVAGSVSGGCIEDDLLATLSEKTRLLRPEILLYGASAEEQARLQLPCGGHLELVLEHLDGEQARQHFALLFEYLRRRKSVWRSVCLKTAALHIEDASTGSEILETLEDERLRVRLGPGERLLIIGSGEVTAYLMDLVESLDVAVTVCEPRASHFQRFQRRYPHHDIRHCLPDDLITAEFQDPFCAVVALAHDPRVDDMGLVAALQSPAFFVGAMGSERTSQARCARLRELGLEPHAIARLQAPVGLPIASKTPPEIAVAVAAQFIAARAALYTSRSDNVFVQTHASA